ncbi:MAG: hypothetical protein V4508_14875 [Pseudomonadota bacterium]
MNQTSSFGMTTLPRAARSALQWRLLLLWALCLLLPTIALALPMWQLLGANLGNSVHAASLAQELDLTAISDLMGITQRNAGSPFGNGALMALALTLLLSPLLSGMVVTAARASETLGFHALAAGGMREYPRMFRMLLWAIVPLAVACAVGGAAMSAATKYGQKVILEADADRVQMGATLVMGLLLVLVHATLDAGRATLATDRRRNSAIKAWWAGCKMLVRRPLATVGVYLVISVAGLVLAVLFAYARINVPHVSAIGFIGALLLTQLVVVVIAWMRSARLFAMIELAQAMQR